MHKHLIPLSAAIVLAPLTVMAQQCDAPAACAPAAPYYNPQCAAPPAPAPPPPPPAPAGNFLRGPATGQAAGESRSFGIRGARIHLPEVTIALPTIEFPSPIKWRRDAEMLFDATRGPLTSAPVQDFGALPSAPAPAPAVAPPQPAPPMYMPPSCTVPAPGCTAQNQNAELERRLAKLEELQQDLAVLREQYSQRLAQMDAGPAAAPSSQWTQRVPAPAVAPRPLPERDRPWFLQANYEELAPSRSGSAGTESTRATRDETAKSRPVFDEDPFGTWISKPTEE